MRRTRRPLTISILAAIFLLVCLSSVRAFEQQFADDAKKIRLRWRGVTINLALSNSLKSAPANFKTGSDVAGAVQRSLATWERAANIRFNIVWTDKQSISSPDGAGDSVNLITVAATTENVASFQGEASEMAGRTRVFFTKRGTITEADIVLNPYQQFSTDGTAGTYDFESALTHEIGHLLGLDHSELPAATMNAQQGKNGVFGLNAFAPRTLSEDDRAGVRSIYGTRGKTEKCCGAIIGTLSLPDGKPASHLQVWAEEIVTGKLAAATFSASNGAFQFAGLRAGKYRILTQSVRESNHSVVLSAAEVGEAFVEKGATTTLNQILILRPKTFDLRFIGFNNQLSTLAVPINAGRSYLVFIGGRDFALENLSEEAIGVNSPYLAVNRASITAQDFGSDVSVLSFQLDVDAETPKGEYSIRLQKKNGETIYFVGSLTVDDVDNQQQNYIIN